jgi:hypothetical protein
MELLPDERLVVTDAPVVCSAANSFLQQAAHTAGAIDSARDAAKSSKYGGGGQVAGGWRLLAPSSMESYVRLGQPAALPAVSANPG